MINIVHSLPTALYDNKKQLIPKEDKDYLERLDSLFIQIKTAYSEINDDSFKQFDFLNKSNPRKVILLFSPLVFDKQSIKGYFNKDSSHSFLTLLAFLLTKKIDLLNRESSNFLTLLKNYILNTTNQKTEIELLLQ